ncbi:MAG: hypothetical protein HN348_02800 [Proteobacteria bacterium]|nr:hypothetical protein [Pseudomonadota bacterium]
MIDPVMMFQDGGPLMYLIVLAALGSGVANVMTLVSKKRNYLGLSVLLALSAVLLGFVGTTMGWMVMGLAVAAMEEPSLARFAQGFGISAIPSVAGCLLGVANVLASGCVQFIRPSA